MTLNKKQKILSFLMLAILLPLGTLTILKTHPWFDHSFLLHPKTNAQIMTEHWPNPDFNDPNFLADFRYYMGFDFHNSEPDKPNPNKFHPLKIFWPLRREY